MLTKRYMIYENTTIRLPDGNYKFIETIIYGIYKSFDAAQNKLQELVQTIDKRDKTGREDVMWVPGMTAIDWEE